MRCTCILCTLSLIGHAQNPSYLFCSGDTGQTTIDQAAGASAAGLFGSSAHSESSDDFADAVSQGHPSRSSSSGLASASSFQTALSGQTDNSLGQDASNAGNDGNNTGTEGEEEVRRSSQRRGRRAGLAGVLGSPSPPRQSRFARFVTSAAAATGLSSSDSSAQLEELSRQRASKLGGKGENQSDQIQPTAGEHTITHPDKHSSLRRIHALRASKLRR